MRSTPDCETSSRRCPTSLLDRYALIAKILKTVEGRHAITSYQQSPGRLSSNIPQKALPNGAANFPTSHCFQQETTSYGSYRVNLRSRDATRRGSPSRLPILAAFRRRQDVLGFVVRERLTSSALAAEPKASQKLLRSATVADGELGTLRNVRDDRERNRGVGGQHVIGVPD